MSASQTGVKWLKRAAPLVLLDAVFAAVFIGAASQRPADLNAMFGTCPAASADPLSVCYDSLAAATAVTKAEAGRSCWTPGGKVIPAAVIMRDPSGSVVSEPLDSAIGHAHQGWTTVAFCGAA